MSVDLHFSCTGEMFVTLPGGVVVETEMVLPAEDGSPRMKLSVTVSRPSDSLARYAIEETLDSIRDALVAELGPDTTEEDTPDA